MDALAVTIRRFVNDHFPGFAECVLTDSDGCEHRFVEKAPVINPVDLSLDSIFPKPGYIACIVQEVWIDEQGRELAHVCTAEPWGVESAAGKSSFTVLREQIVSR